MVQVKVFKRWATLNRFKPIMHEKSIPSCPNTRIGFTLLNTFGCLHPSKPFSHLQNEPSGVFVKDSLFCDFDALCPR